MIVAVELMASSSKVTGPAAVFVLQIQKQCQRCVETPSVGEGGGAMIH